MKAHTMLMNILMKTDNQYICINRDSIPYISLAGTHTFVDLFMDDLWIKPQKWPYKDSGFYVHGGFARRTLRLAKEMDDFISENDDFVIGGYSLGGACSILLASYLVENDKKVRNVLSFGAPPLSSAEFQHFYSLQNLWDKTYNYVIPDDPIVKNIPIYKFVGKKIELDYNADSVWAHHDLKSYELALNSYIEALQ